MAFTTEIYNHSAISYFESQKSKARDDLCNLSSHIVKGSPNKQNDGRRSKKTWALKAFYSDSGAANSAGKDGKPLAPSTCAAAPDRKQSAPWMDHGKVRSNPTDKVAQEITRPQLSIRFTESLITSRAHKFNFCLIGEFTDQTRPKLSLVRRWIREKWALKDKWSLTLLGPSHVLVRLENDDDMLSIWTRQKWVVGGHLMKVFRWSSNFSSSERENTSLAAVWVSFPRLPLVFFEEDLLHSIASLVGKVVAIDAQTRSLRRTDVARVWVEVDLSKELPNKLWIAIGDSGFWQPINFKKLPSYCNNCRLQGHSTNRCKANNVKSRDSTGNRLLEDDDRNSGKWPQFRSLFLDAEEDASLGPPSPNLLTGTPIRNGGELKRSSTSKTVSTGAFCKRKAETFNGEECAFATKEHQRLHSGIQEQAPFQTACNLEEIETAKTVSEAQNGTKVGVRNTNDQSRQDHLVEKQDDRSYTGKKNFKSSCGNGKRDHKVFLSIAEENNDKSREATTPSRCISPEQQICPQEMKEKERKERDSTQVHEFFTNNSPAKHIQYMGAATNSEPYHIKRYKFSDIKKMTRSFRTEIGRGGFGTVYRGKLRDGHLVAVKLLHVEGAEEGFNKEIKIIGKTHHVNIVKLLGFCSESSKRILIYEFMTNGSLDKFIDSPNSLDTKQLHQIAVGVARGLDYLHGRTPNTSVLHLDIKPANILLDPDFCPKICDFGLAKEWKRGEKQSFQATRGTHGYIAPEHFNGSGISSKSDVYSYGVLLLEMGVGKRILSHKRPDLINWVRESLNHQQHQEIPKDDAAMKLIVVGLWCVQADPEDRPSMDEVVKMLQGRIEDWLPVQNHLSLICFSHGITPVVDQNQEKSYAPPSEVVEIAIAGIEEKAKRRVEGARLRKLHTFKGHVESLTKKKRLDMDTIEHQYSI